MNLLIVLLPLASVLQQSLGEEAPKITEKVKQEIIDRHNAIRRDVKPTARNMLKMEWSEKASESAQRWADLCIANTSPPEDRIVDGQNCGESASQTSYEWTWTQAINVWAQAASNFKYGVGAVNPNEGIDIYTQLIWYNSYKIGCGVSFCKDAEVPVYFYVCHYCPAGNQIEIQKKPYKEGPSCGDCPNDCDDKLCTNPCTNMKNKRKDCYQLVSMFELEDGKCQPWLQEECKANCECTNKIV